MMFLQDYVKGILRSVPNCEVVASDDNHTVISVNNIQVLQNMVDIFKQWTRNSYSQYKKPKLFGERGTIYTTYLSISKNYVNKKKNYIT